MWLNSLNGSVTGEGVYSLDGTYRICNSFLTTHSFTTGSSNLRELFSNSHLRNTTEGNEEMVCMCHDCKHHVMLGHPDAVSPGT